MRRSINGVVISIKNKNYLIKTEFGKTYPIKIKCSAISNGDNVYILFDYTENRIVGLHKKGVTFPNKNAVQDQKDENTFVWENGSFSGIQSYEDLGD